VAGGGGRREKKKGIDSLGEHRPSVKRVLKSIKKGERPRRLVKECNPGYREKRNDHDEESELTKRGKIQYRNCIPANRA